MATGLLEISPREINFRFEVMKQSSCSMQLRNTSQHYVAFKVKTTSPKKYSVRPNVGIVPPNSVIDFTVTMQAPQVAPAELVCKDKFLIQSTVVPEGTRDTDITSSMFDKYSGKFVEQSRMKVVFTPSHSRSPSISASPSNELSDPLPAYEEASERKIQVNNDLGEMYTELKAHDESEPVKRCIEEEVKLNEDLRIMKSRIENYESKLHEAEATISKLVQERNESIKAVQQELNAMRVKNGGGGLEAEFPFLFICMVALVSFTIGCLLRQV